MKPVMSDAELKRRKKAQGQIGRTTSTLGLASVGLLGASVAAKKKPKLIKINPEKLKNASFGTSITAGGIGGVGGFNQADIYSAEARKKKPVVKRDEMAPEYGEIAKAWSPVTAKPFDAEEKRHKRAEVAEYATGTAGGLAVGGGALHAIKGAGVKGKGLRLQAEKKKVTAEGLPNAHKYKSGAKQIARGTKTMHRGGKIMAAGAGGLLASHVINRTRKRDGFQTYSKSAWGITHD